MYKFIIAICIDPGMLMRPEYSENKMKPVAWGQEWEWDQKQY